MGRQIHDGGELIFAPRRFIRAKISPGGELRARKNRLGATIEGAIPIQDIGPVMQFNSIQKNIYCFEPTKMNIKFDNTRFQLKLKQKQRNQKKQAYGILVPLTV